MYVLRSRNEIRKPKDYSLMKEDETETIELPERILTKVGNRLPETRFDSESEYITFVMEEVLTEVEAGTGDEEFETVDEDEVKKRLKSLGYLNE